MNFANRINYSIDNIERSIVADTLVGTKYSDARKKKLYQEKLKKLNKFPALKEVINIRHIHNYPI